MNFPKKSNLLELEAEKLRDIAPNLKRENFETALHHDIAINEAHINYAKKLLEIRAAKKEELWELCSEYHGRKYRLQKEEDKEFFELLFSACSGDETKTLNHFSWLMRILKST